MLAARFYLFTKDYDSAARMVRKILDKVTDPVSALEQEAVCTSHWISLERYAQEVSISLQGDTSGLLSPDRRELQKVDSYMKKRARSQQYGDVQDPDQWMAWFRCKQLQGSHTESINILNEVCTHVQNLI